MVERLVAPEAPVWYQTTGRWESGPTSAYYKGLMSILTGKPYPLRVLNASCTNPLSATRNPKKVAEALKKLDFMFVMDVFHAPHVDFADIVLPACTSYEQGDFFGVQDDARRHLAGGLQPGGRAAGGVAQRLAVLSRSGRPHGLRRALLAGRHGRLHERDAGPLRRHRGAVAAEPRGDACEAAGGRRRRRRSHRRPRRSARSTASTRLLFKDLPHGKVQCYNEFIGGKENSDGSGTLPYLPVYQGPPEGLAETPELAKEFPLILSDVHAHRLVAAQLPPQRRLPAGAAALPLAAGSIRPPPRSTASPTATGCGWSLPTAGAGSRPSTSPASRPRWS